MSDDEEISNNIVIDPGSFEMKAGFAGEESPSVLFPSVLGSRRFSDPKKILNPDGYIGNQAQEKRDLLSLRYPIKSGIVTHWDDMEKLLRHSYGELKTEPGAHPVCLIEPPLNPKANGERWAEVLFETMGVPSFKFLDSSYSCLYACGRNSGVMINIGDGVSFAVPFYESFCMSHGIQRQDFAGRQLSQYLQKRLREKGLSFSTTSELETVREIKEKLGYVALDIDIEARKQNHSLDTKSSPSDVCIDGRNVCLEAERFHCPELLFQPSLFGFNNVTSVQNMVYKAIESCELNTRGDIFVNLIISGGCVKFPGFKERLQKEMELLLPPRKRVRVVRCEDMSVWIGGSVYASLSIFQHYLIPKSKYDEYGPAVAHYRSPSSYNYL